MDLQALVTKIKEQSPKCIEPIEGRYDEDLYGPMRNLGDDEDDINCNFYVGFSPQVGDILVLKQDAPRLVGHLNQSMGECSCCRFSEGLDEYVGFIPVETWAGWLKTHDLP